MASSLPIGRRRPTSCGPVCGATAAEPQRPGGFIPEAGGAAAGNVEVLDVDLRGGNEVTLFLADNDAAAAALFNALQTTLGAGADPLDFFLESRPVVLFSEESTPGETLLVRESASAKPAVSRPPRLLRAGRHTITVRQPATSRWLQPIDRDRVRRRSSTRHRGPGSLPNAHTERPSSDRGRNPQNGIAIVVALAARSRPYAPKSNGRYERPFASLYRRSTSPGMRPRAGTEIPLSVAQTRIAFGSRFALALAERDDVVAFDRLRRLARPFPETGRLTFQYLSNALDSVPQ
jgi:hypothetical protein